MPAYDAVGSIRSALGALRAGLDTAGPALVVTSDLRTGRPGSAEEADGGDGAAALLVGSASAGGGPVLAELAGWASATEELLDRWRRPGESWSRTWEERFGEARYVALATEAWAGALDRAGVASSDVDRVVVTGAHGRAVAATVKALGVTQDPAVADVAAAVGHTGAAHPALLLVAALEQARPGETVALVVVADGAEVILWRTTGALAGYRPRRPVRDQLAGAPLPYGRYLIWRGFLAVEPPRRPEPARPSASAASRSTAWKYGFVGSEAKDGTVHLPPSSADEAGRPMAEAVGTVVTFTVDRLAYSPDPPVIFAVVDFDGGGRLPVELTDVDAGEVAVGMRVEMTFRRLFTADAIHNYFWKAGPASPMSSHGIRDRVAVVGMGCTRFAEHWDKGTDDLLVAAAGDALASAGLEQDQVDAFWLGTAQSGMSGIMLARALRLDGKPVTRVENYCATGSEAFRQAAYAVASGAYDIAMAVGVEKVKDAGYQGLNAFPIPDDGTARTVTAAAMFSLIVPAYAERYGVEPGELRHVLARIASKNHANGARNPRAQFQREMTVEKLLTMPRVAGDLSVFDCAGVADGAAAAVLVRAEDAHRFTDHPLLVKALAFVAGSGAPLGDQSFDFTSFPEVVACVGDAYAQAGIDDPRSELAMVELHDCFTPTELVLLEDLGLCERGTAWEQVLAGAFDLDGDLPVNPDGGLKACGHPVGASGLRMMFEAWLQLRGEAPLERRISTYGRRSLALVHNLGGYPGEMVSAVTVLGSA